MIGSGVYVNWWVWSELIGGCGVSLISPQEVGTYGIVFAH